jgi:hypothetical protein
VQKFFVKILVAIVMAGSLIATGSISVGAASAASTAVSVKGPKGQTLTASVAKNLDPDKATKITLTGKGYNTRVGIYATFCVMPEPGMKPEHCGGFDITGRNTQAHWISSKPPFYAQLVTKAFGKGGTFKVVVPVSQMIGEYDCKVVACALTTRADHTRGDFRAADVFVPVTFK